MESVRDHKFQTGYAHSSMVNHRWGHFISHLHQTQEKTEGGWCIPVFVLFANAFRNEAMSVSSERNEVTVSNFESRLYLPALFSANFQPAACRYNICGFPRFSCYYQKLF